MEDAVEGAGEIGRFIGQVPALLSRAGTLIDQLDDITRDGLVLSPETVEAIGAGGSAPQPLDVGGAVGDRGAAGVDRVDACCSAAQPRTSSSILSRLWLQPASMPASICGAIGTRPLA